MLVENLMKLALMGATWVMYLLFVLSVMSIGATIERWWFFKKYTDDAEALGDQITAHLDEGDVQGAREMLKGRASIEAGILGKALKFMESGPRALADAVDSELGKRRKELERGLSLLGTIGSNAPFIGLFGTVIGVIEAFHYLGDSNDDAMGNVMAGIAEALVATGVGLFVAIPAVIAYNVFTAKVGNIENNVASITKQLTAYIEAANAGRPVKPSMRSADITAAPSGSDVPSTDDVALLATD